jgi:hypothetical protein
MNLLAAVLVFIGPADVATATAHERQFEPRLERTSAEAPKSIWRIEASGDGTHLQSTLVCPASLSTFERSALIPFDGFGLDVGCNFDSPTVGRVTIYLTRRSGQALADDFAGAQAAIKVSMPDATPLAGVAPSPNVGLNFTSALYVRGDGRRTGVWVADVSGWTLKFRATYDADRQTETLAAMTALTERAQLTAGVHLAACAAAPAGERTGTRIADADLVMQLSLIASVSEAAGSESINAPPVVERWCAEEAVREREAPLLLWRNIAGEGADGPVDRLSLMTVDVPPMWLVSANAMANMLVDKNGGESAPIIHQLTERRGDVAAIFAFFRGRPGLALLAPLVRDIVLGKTHPVVTYDTKTNTVTVPMQKEPEPGS